MTASQIIYQTLSKDDELNRITNGAVFPVRAPDGTTGEWVTFTQIGGRSEADHSGPSDYADLRYQIDAFSIDPKKVDLMAARIVELLNGKEIIAADPSAVFLHDDSNDTYEDDTKTHGKAIDFSVQI